MKVPKNLTKEILEKRLYEMGIFNSEVINNMIESVFLFYENDCKQVPIYDHQNYLSIEQWNEGYKKWKMKL